MMSEAINEQRMQLCRDFVDGKATAANFIRDFLQPHESSGRHWATTQAELDLDTFLGVVWYDVDKHNEYDDLREPEEFDDAQLHAAVAARLAAWDSGEYDPNVTW